MTNKDKYQTREDAIEKLGYILNETLYLEQSYGIFFGKEWEEIRKDYTEARDAAMAWGVNVSRLPRKLNWNTNHISAE